MSPKVVYIVVEVRIYEIKYDSQKVVHIVVEEIRDKQLNI
jgi:hypothetical protein